MINSLQLLIIILSGISVGIGDFLIKKTAATGSYASILKNPLIIGALFLYIAQIAFLIYIFKQQWHLGIVGNLQVVFYSLTIILAGLFFFDESLSLVQGIGIVLALIGVILMNF